MHEVYCSSFVCSHHSKLLSVYIHRDSLPLKLLYSWEIWRFGGLYYNRQIKIRQNFLLTYIHMAIPYWTAKFKSANILGNSNFGLNRIIPTNVSRYIVYSRQWVKIVKIVTNCALLDYTQSHAAHPVLNRNLRSAAGAGITGPLSVPLRETVVIPCPYERGTFEERYGVTWFQGVQMINTSDVAQTNNRYQVHRNFSLMIQDVMPTDASSAYYCQVHVNTTEGDIITRQSPYITVEVLGKINHFYMIHCHLKPSA